MFRDVSASRSDSIRSAIDRYALKRQLEARDEDAGRIKKSVAFKYAEWPFAVTGTAFIPPACGGRVAFIASH